jgi:hypothetical protein
LPGDAPKLDAGTLKLRSAEIPCPQHIKTLLYSGIYRLINGDCLECPQANLFSPHFKIGNVVLVNPRFFGKVDLAPSASLTQLPYSIPERNADITCHPLYGGISL